MGSLGSYSGLDSTTNAVTLGPPLPVQLFWEEVVIRIRWSLV